MQRALALGKALTRAKQETLACLADPDRKRATLVAEHELRLSQNSLLRFVQ